MTERGASKFSAPPRKTSRASRPKQITKIDSLSVGELIGVSVSLLWLAACAAFFLIFSPIDLSASQESLRIIFIMTAIILPIAIIWVGVAAMRASRIIREETARLEGAIDGIRRTYIKQTELLGQNRPTLAIEQKLDELMKLVEKTQASLLLNPTQETPDDLLNKDKTTPAIPRSAQAFPKLDQTTLELGTPLEEMSPPLSVQDFIRAMHFPENPEDADGFKALRRALKDHDVAGLIQSSQDVLTLLSQDGIYMDDLRPDGAKPAVWRKFAAGERGRAIATLGGINDRSSLALSTGRMRKDPKFREAVHHFLRRFDQIFSAFEKNASDTHLINFANTRTARAFMLLGRVAGTFD